MLSRDLVVDACAVINLSKGGIAHQCMSRIEPRPSVSPAVKLECEKKEITAKTFTELVQTSTISVLDEIVSADEVLSFMEKHDLGAGESEGILVCLALKKHFWSDDRRARDKAVELLSRIAVVGTAGILRDLVNSGDLADWEAVQAYQAMRDKGGFLPKFPDDFFKSSAGKQPNF